MSNSSDQQRILGELQRHVEEGRLGLRDLTERLLPSEMKLLRGESVGTAAWSEASLERLADLVALGHRRRALGSETLRLLVVGFAGAARQPLLDLLERATDPRLAPRLADSAKTVREQLERGALDAALIDLRESPDAAGARLARAEVMRSRLPIVSVVGREHEAQLGALGASEVIFEDELDVGSLTRTLREAVARERAARALDSAFEKEPAITSRDSLTGLPTRAAFLEQLARALHYAGRNQQQVAVLFVAIDPVEGIDAALAAEVGDSLQITVAERLGSALRRSELLARVGTGEFLVMLQGRDLDYAPARTAERLLESLAGAFVVEGREHVLNASIGIAACPRDGKDPETLVRHADAALHQLKAEGGHGYRFYGLSLNDVDSRRHHVAQRVRGALGRGELSVHFQPFVDARSGAIVGAEALLRWTDAELGSVSPAEFVPIAERSGLMCEIGSFVLREACRAHAAWSAAGHRGLRVSVNVSAHQVQSASLRDAVVESVMASGLAPGSLEIELTESALVDNQSTAALLLRELAEIGVTLALDDFGTGFSALSHLRTFPVRTLKIDSSFVREIVEGQPFPPFVHAILSLAGTLGLGVVAEGVETGYQRRALLERGCPWMQGFLFSRAVSAEAFLALLRSGAVLPAA